MVFVRIACSVALVVTTELRRTVTINKNIANIISASLFVAGIMLIYGKIGTVKKITGSAIAKGVATTGDVTKFGTSIAQLTSVDLPSAIVSSAVTSR